jgi:hypothetical protein
VEHRHGKVVEQRSIPRTIAGAESARCVDSGDAKNLGSITESSIDAWKNPCVRYALRQRGQESGLERFAEIF